MTPSRPRTWLLRLAAALTAVTVAAACSSAVDQAKQASGAAGGTLVVGTLSDLTPSAIYSQSTTSMTIGRLLYDTLIRYDRATGTPQPAVAKSWTVSPDGRTVTLALRDDVKFHNGRPLTSEDVAYSLKTYASAAAASQLRPAAAAVTAVDTADPHVAVLHLAHPLVNLFDLLEFVLLTDRETPDQLKAGEQFIGTGPFKFAGWQRGQQVRLVRNDDYWNGAPKVDEVDLKVIPDETALLNSVRSGQTNVVVDASVQALTPFRGDDAYTVEPENIWDVNYYIGANVTDPALSHRAVRQAIAYAVDRERILHEVFGDTGSVNSAPWSPDSPAYNQELATRYTRDLTKARDLLTQAGGAPAQPLRLSYNTALAPAKSVAAIVQNNLADIGIKVELEPLDGAALTQTLNSGRSQLWINPHGFGQNSPATLATGAAPFKPEGNLSGYRSADYAALVERVWEQPDPDSAAAHAAYDAYTQLLSDEQFVINLVSTTVTNVYTGSVRGVDWNTYKYLILDKATVK
ncbi:ABC transporter substrate-binding protein [Amycolatopsis thermoflava]|uniref:ABC transporter substrate-binding protein n=1 Tax=Amycolatopsis thermoflava TaxID=84480 RepID=UPI00365C0BDD